MRFDQPRVLSPWGGALGIALEVSDAGAGYDGLVKGEITLEVESLAGPFIGMVSMVVVPLIGEAPFAWRIAHCMWAVNGSCTVFLYLVGFHVPPHHSGGHPYAASTATYLARPMALVGISTCLCSA